MFFTHILDAFSEAMDEAESLIASSMAAEKEGNLLEPLLEAFHLCREAGSMYLNSDLNEISLVYWMS